MFGVYRIGEGEPALIYSDRDAALRVCRTLNESSVDGWAYIVEALDE